MAINLQQPLGTDIYNISVFNSNAQVIQDAVNTAQEAIDLINSILPNKFPFSYITTTETDIDSVDLTDGIYYLSIQPSGTLPENIPSTNNILIISNINNSLSEYLLTSDGKLYQRTVTTSTVDSWKQITVQIVDNLTTQDENQALSAKQGYILNNNKITLFYHNISNPDTNSINFDNADSGIHICDGTSISGTIPDFISIDTSNPTNNNFIFESYGKIGETAVLQRISNTRISQQGTRVGYVDSTSSNWVWKEWLTINIGETGGGGGGDSDIKLEIVEL